MSKVDFVCEPPKSCFSCPFTDCINVNAKVTYDEAEYSKCRQTKASKRIGQEYHIALHSCSKQKLLL